MRAAARVRGPGWELARSGRPRVPARDTAERACAPRRGREASRPYLLPGQRRQRGAGAREARREKALRMRGQSQRVSPPPPPPAADRENTASKEARSRLHSSPCQVGGAFGTSSPPGVHPEELQKEPRPVPKSGQLSPEKPIGNVADGVDCTAFGVLWTRVPFPSMRSRIGEKKTPRGYSGIACSIQ